MKQPPDGRSRIGSSLFYDDAHGAIDFLCRAFGFELRLKVEGEGGRVEYSELVFGEGVVTVSQSGDEASSGKSPRAVGGANTQSLAVIVDDVDAHFTAARAAGATIVEPPATHDYGDDYWTDRSYRAEDPEGHRWAFWQRIREGKRRAP